MDEVVLCVPFASAKELERLLRRLRPWLKEANTRVARAAQEEDKEDEEDEEVGLAVR